MDLSESPTSHVNPAALAHVVGLLVADGVTKTEIAERRVGLHLSNLSHLMAGRRSGEDTLPQIAAGLGVPRALLACWCDRPGGRCRNAPEVTP